MLSTKRKPKWLKAKMPGGEGYDKLKDILQEHKLFHRVRGGRLPQYGRVLGAGCGDDHDPGRHLHSLVRVLQREDRQAPGSR